MIQKKAVLQMQTALKQTPNSTLPTDAVYIIQ